MMMTRRFFSSLLLISALIGAQAGAQPAGELTTGLIERRLDVLRAGGAGDEDETVLAYQEARQFLTEAESRNHDTASYVESLTTAPAREAEIQARIDAIDEGADPLVDLGKLSSAELAARLPRARTELSEANAKIATLDRRLAAREIDAASMRSRLLEIARSIDTLPDESIPVDPSAPPSMPEATQWRNSSQLVALAAERRALEARLASQPARHSAMAVERAELLYSSARLSGSVRALESRTRDEVVALVDPVTLGIADAAAVYPIAVKLTTADADLTGKRVAVNDRLAEVGSQIEAINSRARALEDRFATARRIVDFAADSDVLGRLLLTYWREIESFTVANPTNRLSRNVSTAVVRRIENEQTLAMLVTTSGFVNQALRDAGIDPGDVSQSDRSILVELTGTYRSRLREIIAADSNYIGALTELEADYTALTQRLEEYSDYLEGLVLWIPNHPPLWQIHSSSLTAEITALLAAYPDIEVSFSWLQVFWLGILLLLLYLRPRIASYQITLNGLITRPRDDSIRHTLRALLCVATRSLPLPVLFLTLGSMFPGSGSLITGRLAELANGLAALLFVLGILGLLCESNGVARLHYDWSESSTQRTSREIGWLVRWWLPLATIAAAINLVTPDVGDAIVPRTALLIATLTLIAHLARDFVNLSRQSEERWHQGVLNRSRLAALGVLGLIAAAVVVGLVFSVTVIVAAVIKTVGLGIGLLILHASLKRWLRVARRHLRMNELLSQSTTEVATAGGETIEIKQADLGDISAETLELVNVAAVTAAIAALIFVWAPLLPAFEAFGRVTLWTSSTVIDGETIVNEITLATLLVVTALVGLTLFAARKLPALVELMMRAGSRFSPGARYATSTLLNYLIVGTGIIAALSSLGVAWSQLQWLVAALGVGIGFGLQEIVANFISGLIILFERPIRVGDIVTIGDKDGAITKIRIRATTLRDWDGKELLVPNKEFITGRLLNWTLSDQQTRLVIPVGIAYGSDVELALRTLTDVVAGHPGVLKDPEPSVLFLGFGDNSLNMVARCFVGSIDQRMPTTSSLHIKINAALKEVGIVVAFPQRDVHLDASGPIRIAIDESEKG